MSRRALVYHGPPHRQALPGRNHPGLVVLDGPRDSEGFGSGAQSEDGISWQVYHHPEDGDPAEYDLTEAQALDWLWRNPTTEVAEEPDRAASVDAVERLLAADHAARGVTHG